MPNKAFKPTHPIKKATYQGGFILKNLLKHWRDGFADHLKVAPVLVVDLESIVSRIVRNHLVNIPFRMPTSNALQTRIVSFTRFLTLPFCLLFVPTELGNDKTVNSIKRLRNR